MQATIALQLWPVNSRYAAMRAALLMLGGSLALAVSSKISVPFHPVPMTMQTLVLLMLGLAYGWKLAGATILLYLLEGAAGLPVFAGTPEKDIGIAYMLGGTGGYLIGFVAAAALCGYLAERGWDRRILSTDGAMLLGNVVIYVPGLLWLGALYGWDMPVLEWGLWPFVSGDLVKIVLAAGLMPLCWRLLGRRSGAHADATATR